jgi:hypothetical protein
MAYYSVPEDDLIEHIDLRGVEVLNATSDDSWSYVLKTGERDQDSLVMTSDDDETLILSVPFNTNIKPTSVRLCGGGCGEVSAFKVVKIFVNKPSMGFEECAKKKPAQVFTVNDCENADGIYILDKTAFDNIRTLTFYFESNVGDTDRTGVTRVEIRGQTMHAADVTQLKPC